MDRVIVKVKKELREVLNVYHLVHVLFAVAFPLSKLLPLCCERLYGEENCGFTTREHEALVFFGVLVAWKGRKSASVLHYLSNVYLLSKLVNGVLFFMNHALYGILYSLAAIVFVVLFPEPVRPDSLNITYFQGEGLQRELERDKSVVWIVEFFTTWSTESRYASDVFSKLSEKYALPNLRFGKLDLGRYPREAERFRISTNPFSKQIPSISVFQGGVQTNRRPAVGSNSRVVPFVFNEENCILELELNELYEQCKRKMKKQPLKDENGGAKPEERKKDI